MVSKKDKNIAKGPDDLKAVVIGQDGRPKAPIAVKSGEFVMSNEAIIGAGKGSHEAGSQFMEKLHSRLKKIGHQYLGTKP